MLVSFYIFLSIHYQQIFINFTLLENSQSKFPNLKIYGDKWKKIKKSKTSMNETKEEQ